MARVTGVPISLLLSRGQSIKVLSQLLRKAEQKNLVIPCVSKQGSEDSTFEGATVLEARTGFYEKPIATLDFASLYPSIMMAYNLCYCTLVTPEDVRKLNLPPDYVNKTPSGETFVESELQKGILPEILEELLAARKRAKADVKEAKDPLEKLCWMVDSWLSRLASSFYDQCKFCIRVPRSYCRPITLSRDLS